MTPYLTELRVALVQAQPVWHDPEYNIAHYEELVAAIMDVDLILLPEMWPTGYTIQAHKYYDTAAAAIDKMKKWAAAKSALVVGSMIAKDVDRYYNRLYIVEPTGVLNYYDKKHLFGFAGEDRVYTPGKAQLSYDYKGWRLRMNVCYDLRFPVWSRNTDNYDVILYSANWPDKRIDAWRTLLKARAIENQAYTLGCNCVGGDLWNNTYTGYSTIINPHGEVLAEMVKEEGVLYAEMTKETLALVRDKLPFLADQDRFELL